jgi:hypothetical protein
MDKLFSLLKLHSLAIMAFVAAFLFWKDYLTKPHQKVEKGKLAQISGTLSGAGNNISLPSGSSSGHYIIIKEANTTFIPARIKWSEFVDEVADSAIITMAYSQEENPKITGEGIPIFSLKHNNKEYITETEAIEWYNKTIDKKRNTAIYATLAGFLAIGLVEVIRRKFLK